MPTPGRTSMSPRRNGQPPLRRGLSDISNRPITSPVAKAKPTRVDIGPVSPSSCGTARSAGGFSVIFSPLFSPGIDRPEQHTGITPDLAKMTLGDGTPTSATPTSSTPEWLRTAQQTLANTPVPQRRAPSEATTPSTDETAAALRKRVERAETGAPGLRFPRAETALKGLGIAAAAGLVLAALLVVTLPAPPLPPAPPPLSPAALPLSLATPANSPPGLVELPVDQPTLAAAPAAAVEAVDAAALAAALSAGIDAAAQCEVPTLSIKAGPKRRPLRWGWPAHWWHGPAPEEPLPVAAAVVAPPFWWPVYHGPPREPQHRAVVRSRSSRRAPPRGGQPGRSESRARLWLPSQRCTHPAGCRKRP